MILNSPLAVLAVVGLIVFTGCLGGIGGDTDPTETRDPRRYNIGICPDNTDAGITLVKKHAESVRRVMEFGEQGAVVTGQFNESALETLQQHPYIKYVEPDLKVQHQDNDGSSETSTSTVGANGCKEE